jgi:hypothetical protein
VLNLAEDSAGVFVIVMGVRENEHRGPLTGYLSEKVTISFSIGISM